MGFEPFLDRLSRDIRNDLSATVQQMLEKLDLKAAQAEADKYLGLDIESYYKNYIYDRLARYQAALKTISAGSDDVFWRGLVFWDQGLFFEVHEILEQAWYTATADEKKILQAMIRAAGVYIKLEYGYTDAARKLADRALPVLLEQHGYLSRYFDPAVLVTALQKLDHDPPRLLH